MMGNIEKLTSLEELELYSMDKSANFASEVGKMTEMRVLEIHFDAMDKSTETALVDSLRNLGKIQTLEISCKEKRIVPFGVWEDCAPPSELRRLLLSGMTLPRRPSWMESSCVPHLSYLWFSVKVMEELDMYTLGMLPFLQYLYLFVNEEEEEEKKEEGEENDNYQSSSYAAGSDKFHMLRHLITNMEITCEEEEEGGKNNYQSSSYAVGSDKFQILRHLITNIEITCEDGALLMLEELECCTTMGKYKDVGLVPRNMLSLQRATYRLDCNGYSLLEVNEAEAALMHMAETHPNHPVLRIVKFNYDFVRDYVVAGYPAEDGAGPREHNIEIQITLLKSIGLKESPHVKLSTRKYGQLELCRLMTLVENSFHDSGPSKKQLLEGLRMSFDDGEVEEEMFGLLFKRYDWLLICNF